MIVGSFGTEVHEQIDGVRDPGRVLGGLEDGLVACFLLLFLGRHRALFCDRLRARRSRFLEEMLGGARPAALRRRGSASALEELTKYAAEAVL